MLSSDQLLYSYTAGTRKKGPANDVTSCAMPEKVEKGGSGKKKNTRGYSRLFSSQSGSLEQVTKNTDLVRALYLHGVKYHQT